MPKMKCTIVGDYVGKTKLLMTHTENEYPLGSVIGILEIYSIRTTFCGKHISMDVYDTPAEDDYDGLRPQIYQNTDVFLVCFSVVQPNSLENVRNIVSHLDFGGRKFKCISSKK